MSTINYDTLFTNLPSILNLPLKRKGLYWVLNTYMDLRKHSRMDKLVFRKKNSAIQVIEQGGEVLSLYKWLLDYGNCKDEREVMDRLTSGSFSLNIAVSDMLKEQEVRYVDAKYIDRLCLQPYDPEKPHLNYKDNNLYKYLCGMFPEELVYAAFDKYRVGTIGNRCVFWKSDSKGRWVNDNRIEYLETGKRNKEKNAFRKFTTTCGFTKKGYFAWWLVNRGDTVCMVESEKTAIICSIVYPDKVWIACSGLNNIHYCNKAWLLYPDYAPEAIDTWKRKGTIVEWWNDFVGVEHNNDIADLILLNKYK